MAKPTAERLRDLYDYSPETGSLTRRTSSGGRIAGSLAGSLAPDGRIQIYVDGRNYKAHRLIWLMVTGVWPRYDVDHIDGVPSNNRWNNLRDVPHAVNLQNRRGPTRANRNKMIGVTRNHERFAAQIKINGIQTYLGTYDTPEEAHAVYLEMKRKVHAGCTI